MLSGSKYNIGAVCENDFVLREFSFAVIMEANKRKPNILCEKMFHF